MVDNLNLIFQRKFPKIVFYSKNQEQIMWGMYNTLTINFGETSYKILSIYILYFKSNFAI